MAYRLFAENERGERLELTGNRNFDVLSVDGTSPPAAAINTVPIVGLDGTRFNSSRVEQRNIVLSLNIHHPIEDNRIVLYRFFRSKRWVRLIYENSHRRVYIDGYVETFENNLWTELQQPQISIICPQPFWISDTDTAVDFSNVLPLFEFPFDIPAEGIEFSQLLTVMTATVDVGEVQTGGVIRFHALADGVENPKFFNETTGEFFGVDITMQLDDLIIVNTNQGQKSVVLIRDGTTTNLLSQRTVGSVWLQFISGVNTVSYGADSGDVKLLVDLTIVRKYEGV